MSLLRDRRRLGLQALALLLVGSLSSCAVWNRYDYRAATVALPLQGSGELGFVAIDSREYVLDGSHDPDFVGVQRSGLNIPYEVTTKSREGLVDDLKVPLTAALEASGFIVIPLEAPSADESVLADVARTSGLRRVLVFDLKNWRTDVHLNTTLDYDLRVLVLDDSGTVLAENEMAGSEKASGAGSERKNAKSLQSVFERKVSFLFTSDELRDALAPQP